MLVRHGESEFEFLWRRKAVARLERRSSVDWSDARPSELIALDSVYRIAGADVEATNSNQVSSMLTIRSLAHAGVRWQSRGSLLHR